MGSNAWNSSWRSQAKLTKCKVVDLKVFYLRRLALICAFEPLFRSNNNNEKLCFCARHANFGPSGERPVFGGTVQAGVTRQGTGAVPTNLSRRLPWLGLSGIWDLALQLLGECGIYLYMHLDTLKDTWNLYLSICICMWVLVCVCVCDSMANKASRQS